VKTRLINYNEKNTRKTKQKNRSLFHPASGSDPAYRQNRLEIFHLKGIFSPKNTRETLGVTYWCAVLTFYEMTYVCQMIFYLEIKNRITKKALLNAHKTRFRTPFFKDRYFFSRVMMGIKRCRILCRFHKYKLSLVTKCT
jgi:hypothetical protein